MNYRKCYNVPEYKERVLNQDIISKIKSNKKLKKLL